MYLANRNTYLADTGRYATVPTHPEAPGPGCTGWDWIHEIDDTEEWMIDDRRGDPPGLVAALGSIGAGDVELFGYAVYDNGRVCSSWYATEERRDEGLAYIGLGL